MPHMGLVTPGGDCPGDQLLLVPLLATTEDILGFLVPWCRLGCPGVVQVNAGVRTGRAESDKDVAAACDGAIAARLPGARQGDPEPCGDEP